MTGLKNPSKDNFGHLSGRLMRRALFGLVVAALLAAPAIAREIRIVTEEFPPYDFSNESGRVEGLSTDVVRAVLSDLGFDVSIEIFPWARAFKMASENPNVMLFSVVRTEERESLFHWVGVVCDVRSYLYKLRSRDEIAANSLSTLKAYRTGVVRGWAGKKYLERNKFQRLEEVTDSDQNILKLVQGRVDLIEDYEANLIFRMRKLGLDPDLVEKVYYNEEISGPLYAVFSKETPDELVQRFRDAFFKVHQDGRYAAIQRKWLRAD